MALASASAVRIMSSWAASSSSRAVLASVEEGAAGGEVGLLAQQGDAGAGVEAHVAVVGPVEAGEQAQQRGLADAVGADEADALAGVQLEADVLEQRPFVEAARQAGATQQ